MSISFQVRGLDTATAEVQAAVEAGIQEGLGVTGARAEALVKQNIGAPYLGRPPAVATGNLVNSITFEISRQAHISRARIFAGAPADQYADYVEGGTGPHFPPPSALLLWVERKFRPANEKQAMEIAFLVARKIARRGTSAFGMFARALNVLQSELQGIMEAAIARALTAAGAAK